MSKATPSSTLSATTREQAILDNALDAAMFAASAAGDADAAKTLLPILLRRQRPVAAFLADAASHGCLPIVQLLDPHVDPATQNGKALIWAANNGHRDVVEFLLPKYDPSASDYQALQLSAHGFHLEVFDLLLRRVKNPSAALRRLPDLSSAARAILQAHIDERALRSSASAAKQKGIFR